ncbi:MAG TPA: PAS domain-containing protein [bacterium]|nr:PAS domain-containing protein [bacterium]
MSEAITNAAARAAGFSTLLDALILGGNSDAVQKATPLVEDARPEDLVNAVDAAVAAGVDFALLKPAISRLVNLLSASLRRHRCTPGPGERLFASLVTENAGLLKVLDEGKLLAKSINDARASARDMRSALLSLRALVVRLGAVEAHYRKKENVLFPWFEARNPEYRCVRVMWEIQDDARRGLEVVTHMIDAALPALDSPQARFDPAQLNKALGRLYFDLNANVFREDFALFPVMLNLMPIEADDMLFVEASEYGYSFLDEATIRSFGRHQVQASLPISADAALEGFRGRTGSLSNQVLAAMFAALPVDMTYVDADDKVRWFSDSPHRIFPRSPAIVGRDVRNCHPGASVGRVVAIIEAFRRGEKDREAFWISMQGRFIHIEYFALRDADGTYLGVLEASQDLTDKRALSGEKRLAD